MKTDKRLVQFLFDTWYGVFVVLYGATALLVAVTILDRFIAWTMLMHIVGLSSLALLLIAGIVFFVAWVVSLFKRRWKRALLQAALGVIWELTIPPEVEATIVTPESGFEDCHFSTADVYDDDFALSVFKSLAKDGGEDATVTCDLSGLADLVHNRRDELMAYLARHPGWWLHEDRGHLYATRRLRVRGVWNHPLHGYYSGNSRTMRPGEDFEVHRRTTRFQTRTTLGFPYSPSGRERGAEHPATATVVAGLREWGGSTVNPGDFTSSECFGDKDFCVEVFEQTTARERRITNAALSFLKAEFASDVATQSG